MFFESAYLHKIKIIFPHLHLMNSMTQLVWKGVKVPGNDYIS